MDLRRLRYFLRIADEGSMSRAASVLGIAQPALSRQVRLLEEALGVVLFRRTPRGVALTEEGEQLRASMTGPLRQLELAMQNVGSPFAQLEGGVVLGLPATVASVLAEPLVGRVATAFPKVKLRVVDRETGQLIEAMLRGEVDLGVIHGPAPDERLFESDLLVEALVLVGGPGSDLSPDRPVAFARLADLPLALPGVQPGVRSLVEKTALRAQVALDIRVEVDSLQVTKDLIEAGQVHSVLPASAVGREVAAGRLRYAPICDPVMTQQLAFVARPHLVMPRSFVAEFGALVRREVAQLVQSGAWPATLAFA
ncbi:LysR family transcriptional regulator [Phenylobacterium sp. LjRoot219]|uniref:LysR family transcriptional regulator n=1 Tax=Phenylobacterium sp. LjRoot219 TaxID=3342283 RepID=UPI003ECEBEFD